MKSKKTAFISSIALLSFLIFIQKDNLKEKFQSFNKLRKNINQSCLSFYPNNCHSRESGNLKKTHTANQTIIASPCRTVSQKLVSKSNLNRAQKLNRLMDTSIDWVFKDIKGEVIDLYCLRGGKKIVLNFWATWCPPCIKELSSLAQLAKDNKDRIFVIAVSTEDKNTVQSFLTRSFSDLDSALAVVVVSEEEKLKYFPKDSLPATYIFNTKGFLKMKELGDRNWSDKNIVQSILNLD